MDPGSLVCMALDRTTWGSHEGEHLSEKTRAGEILAKKKHSKSATMAAHDMIHHIFVCTACGKQRASRIGLSTHHRTQNKQK